MSGRRVEVGLGFGLLGVTNMPPVSDADARDTFKAACDAGVCHFDTAPLYGGGVSEERLGQLLRTVPRERVHVSTKVGHYRQYGALGADWWDFGADCVRRSIDSSLQRLGVQRIDTVFLHDCDDHVEAAARDAYPVLRQLQQEGVIGAVGAGCNRAHTLDALLDRIDLDTVMVAGRYTLLDQSAAVTLFPRCQERKVRVIMAAPFNSGILATGSGASQTRFDYQPPDAAMRARVRAIEDICQAHGVTLKAAALQFAASHPAITQLMLGFIDVAGLQSNLRDLETPLPAGLWRDLAASGAIQVRGTFT